MSCLIDAMRRNPKPEWSIADRSTGKARIKFLELESAFDQGIVQLCVKGSVSPSIGPEAIGYIMRSAAIVSTQAQRLGDVGQRRARSDRRKSCRIVQIRDAAKLGDLRMQDLRRSFGSHALNEGVTLSVVSKQLGHADTRITQNVYAHLADSTVAEALDALDPKSVETSDSASLS